MGVKSSGLNKLMNDLSRLANEVGGELPEKMLDAGAEAAVQDWKDGIIRSKHIDKGDMLAAVGVAPETKTGKKREIYPLGVDRKGVRNAEKAFVLNYGRGNGTSKRKRRRDSNVKSMKGDRFADKIQKSAEESTYKAMARVFDEETRKI